MVRHTASLTLAFAMSMSILSLAARDGPGSVITPTFRSSSGQHLSTIAEGLTDGSGGRSNIVPLDVIQPSRECSITKTADSPLDPATVPNASRDTLSAREECAGHYMYMSLVWCCDIEGEPEFWQWYWVNVYRAEWEDGWMFGGDYVCEGLCQNEEDCWHEPPEVPDIEASDDQ